MWGGTGKLDDNDQFARHYRHPVSHHIAFRPIGHINILISAPLSSTRQLCHLLSGSQRAGEVDHAVYDKKRKCRKSKCDQVAYSTQSCRDFPENVIMRQNAIKLALNPRCHKMKKMNNSFFQN